MKERAIYFLEVAYVTYLISKIFSLLNIVNKF